MEFLPGITERWRYTIRSMPKSEEKRLDIVITYHTHKYGLELKRWYGEAAHRRGLQQLASLPTE